ncbi:MAG: hypothetical protein M1823_004804 [Watsoniomyces obsoletus]|nr:MAG: hypothetical protein M1823_004804 [Watsoniomyces obsoletus]
MWTSTIPGIFSIFFLALVSAEPYEDEMARRKSRYGFVLTTYEANPLSSVSMWEPGYHALAYSTEDAFIASTFKMEKNPTRPSRRGKLAKPVMITNNCCAQYCVFRKPMGDPICQPGSGQVPTVSGGWNPDGVVISCDGKPACETS